MSAQNETARRCPICGKPEMAELRPFCSKRCADVDLGRWLKGSYVVPGREVDEGDGAQSSTPIGESDLE